MAKIDTAGQYESLRKEIESGNFKPVYILMGEEPFYPERLCSLIMERALQPHERDFNQTVLYGADTSAEEIVSICERYPMMAERTLVVVREAQALKKPEGLGVYLDHISPTTVLVLLFSGKNMDKRTSFYKKAAKSCVIFESVKVREEAMPRWIESWFRSIGRSIEPQGAMLLAEYAGNDLRKISVESNQLLKAVPHHPTPLPPPIGPPGIKRAPPPIHTPSSIMTGNAYVRQISSPSYQSCTMRSFTLVE